MSRSRVLNHNRPRVLRSERLESRKVLAGELLAVELDVMQDGASILDENREFAVQVGDRFDLEVQFDHFDLSEDGPFQILPNIAASMPGTFRPLVRETQTLSFLGDLESITGGEVVVGVEGSDETRTVSVASFTNLGLRDAAAELLEVSTNQIEVTSLNLSDLEGTVFVIEFLSEEFALRNMPNLTADASGVTGTDLVAESNEFPAYIANDPARGINPSQLYTAVDLGSRDFNGAALFGGVLRSARYEVSDTVALLEGVGGFLNVSRGGPQPPQDLADEEGVTYTGMDVEAFSVRLEAVAPADGVTFEIVFPPAGAEGFLWLGVDDELTAERVLIGEEASLRGNFVSIDPGVVSINRSNRESDTADLPSGVQPTSWSRQRSRLGTLEINLPVEISNVSPSDLVLTNLGVDSDAETDVVIPLQADQLELDPTGQILMIRLGDSGLTDGVYRLELFGTITGGEPLVVSGNASNGLYVLEGDWNGSGAVNIQDFATFAYWFGQQTTAAPSYVDLNGSGAINIQDFAGFAANFGKEVRFAQASGEQIPQSSVPLQGDTNRDGRLSAGDALKVINALDDGSVTNADSALDANGDQRINAADALYVINRLDSRTGASLPQTDDEEAVDIVMRDQVNSLF